MGRMDATQATRLIEAAGGDTAFAKLLGIDAEPGVQQRVNNWKRRGLPPAVMLDHYDTIKQLQKGMRAHA